MAKPEKEPLESLSLRTSQTARDAFDTACPQVPSAVHNLMQDKVAVQPPAEPLGAVADHCELMGAETLHPQ